MATTSAPAPAPIPAPLPAPAPTPTPAPAPVKSGWLTSEHLLTVLAIFVNTLISANVIPSGSEASKIVMMVSTMLGALGYGVYRSAVKINARNVAANDNRNSYALDAISSFISKSAAAVLLIGALAFGASLMTGCKSLGGAPAPGQGSGSAASDGSGFVTCSEVNLEGAVGNKTLLGTVVSDLLSGNYAAAIAELIGVVGINEAGCALLAIEDLESTLATGSGAGSAAAPLAASNPLVLQRARELIKKYGFVRAPAVSK